MPDPTDADRAASHGSGHRQPGGRGSRLPIVIVAALSVIAIGLSGWALIRPAPRGGSTQDADYSDAQRSASKATICAAFDTVRKGVTLNTNLQAPGGTADVTGSLAVAANARLSLYDGGQYLIAKLEPATPGDLAQAVESFAKNLMDIGAAATAGVVNSDPAQAVRLRDADTSNTTIVRLCQ